jgi:hypothetical protein
MSGDETMSRNSAKLARRLRMVAVAVFALGLVGAEVVYLVGTRAADTGLDDPSMLGYDKASARQAGSLYGAQGVIVQQWTNDLKRPGTQAGIILGTTALAAGACLYFARLMQNGGE